jgi:hypothetical protein
MVWAPLLSGIEVPKRGRHKERHMERGRPPCGLAQSALILPRRYFRRYRCNFSRRLWISPIWNVVFPVENIWPFMRDNWLSNRFSNPTTTSSNTAASPGTTSSICLGKSCPSEPVNGPIGRNQRDLVITIRFVRQQPSDRHLGALWRDSREFRTLPLSRWYTIPLRRGPAMMPGGQSNPTSPTERDICDFRGVLIATSHWI